MASPVTLAIKENAASKFHRARPVPFALKDKVETELKDLQDKGPVQHSAWAATVVAILKKSGNVCLCGDYKLTINQATPTETYPLPHVDEFLANMSGAKYFSKLNLTSAYLQMPLDSASREYVTVNTLTGLFQYNHLPFGVASAGAIFQLQMEMLLQGVEGVSVYIDDIIISGAILEEHLSHLAEVELVGECWITTQS